MKNSISNPFQKGISMVKLPSTIRYELMFMISSTLYHSLDYFFINTSSYPYQLFLFKYCATISLNIGAGILTLITLVLNLLIIYSTFYRKRASYISEILQKIVFPLQVYFFILLRSSSTQNNRQRNNVIVTILTIFLVLSLLTSIVLINILSFKLHIRHKNTREQVTHPIGDFHLILDQFKLVVSASFGLIFPNQLVIYLIVIFGINVSSNILFALRVHYDNPKYEYLNLLFQFYRWVPVILGLLTFTKVQPVTIEWVNFVLFSAFISMGLSKPKVLMFLLETKYRIFVNKFDELINSNSRSNKKVGDNTQTTLSYLSVSLSIFCHSKNGLKWSNSFKTQINNVLLSYVNKAHQIIVDNIEKEKEKSSNHKRNLKTMAKMPQNDRSPQQVLTSSRSILVMQPLQIQNEQNFSFSSKNALLYKRLYQFLHSILPLQSNLPCYLQFLCFNLPGITNMMKQQLFYFHFLNASQNGAYFEKLSTQITHSRLMDIIGQQKIIHQYQHKAEMLDKSLNLKKSTKNFIEQKTFANLQKSNGNTLQQILSEGQNCFHIEKPYFTNKFNSFMPEHQIFSTILEKLSQFVANQNLYLKITQLTYENKDQITEYLKKRNSLRHQIQEKIRKYSSILNQNGKILKASLLNYIQDNWLNRNPILALDGFKKSLQEKTFTKDVKKKYAPAIFTHSQNHNKKSIKLVCMISAISSPNSIVASSSEFNNLLEIADQTIIQANADNQVPEQNSKYMKVDLDSLMLPIFKEPHQKVTSSFYQKPIDHVQKRYFLISKRWSNLLEIKFKMYFHMMYEQDLLIVLDIGAEKVSNLIIADKESNQILFEHDLNNELNKKQRRNEISNSFDLKGKVITYLRGVSGIPKINEPKGPIKDRQTESLSLFGRQYKIFIKKQPHQQQKKITLSYITDAENEIKSRDQLKIVHETEKESFERQKRLKEFKFHVYKEQFANKNSHFIPTLMYLMCFFIATIISFTTLISYQNNGLYDMMNVLKDKMQLEQEYAKENIYQSIDLGMLANLYSGLIDQSVMNPNVIDHIFASIKNSIDTMKLRHQFNPFTLINSIRTDHYWEPCWIPNQNNSFEMMTLINQMDFLQCSKNYLIIQQLPYSNTTIDYTLPHDLKFSQNLPMHKFSSMESLWNFRYLLRLINDQMKFTHPVNGIFSKFKQNENQIFNQITNYYHTMMNFFIGFFVFLAAGRIYLAFRSAKDLTNKYDISLETSQNFRREFQRSIQELKKCIQEMKKFNHETPMKIIKHKQFNYHEIIIKKTYTVASNYTFKDNLNTKEKLQQKKESILKSNEKRGSTSYYSKFILSFLRYPIVKFIVITLLFSWNFMSFSSKVSYLKTYSVGLEKLSTINLELLNLMSQNLFLFSLNTFQLKPNEQGSTMMEFREIFTKTLTQVSTTDKASIIKQLFLQEPSSEQVVSKILYQNLCTSFPVQMDCPTYMVPNINGLLQKYGQTVKSINLLFHKINLSNKTESGLPDTQQYQSRYIESYQNINELMYINKKIRMISFENLQKFIGVKVSLSLSLKKESENEFPKEFYFLFGLVGYLFIECILSLSKLFKQTKTLMEEFLRIGTYKMFENEKNSFEGYDKFINIAQKYERLQQV